MRGIISETEARQKLLTGIQKLADTVGSTLGPYGRTVTIWKGYGTPITTKDGVSVAKEVLLTDPYEAAGAELVKAAAKKTAEEAGDGTTTATILAAALVDSGLDALKEKGMDIRKLRAQYTEGLEAVEATLQSLKKEVTSADDLVHVTSISANDPSIGAVLGPALWNVGRAGLATVEAGSAPGIKVKETEGYRFDKGWIAPQFVSDAGRLRSVLTDCVVYATPRTLTAGSDVIEIFKSAVEKDSKALLMIVGEMESEALATAIYNRQQGMIDVVVVKAPGFGERREELLGDIMATVGGKMHGLEEKWDKETMLGRADKVEVDRMETVIFGGKGERKAVEDRLMSIETLRVATKSDFDREELQKRAEALQGRAVSFEVGGRSETEALELYHRIEDAVFAGKAAMREGVLPGRGKALINASMKSMEKFPHFSLALLAPAIRLLANASIPFDQITEYSDIADPWKGKDFENWGGEPIDYYEHGVMDPYGVTISALKNATSAALMVLSTDHLIVELPEEKK